MTPAICNSFVLGQGFQKKMAEVMENLEAGEMAFDDLNGEGRGRWGRGVDCS